MVPDPQQAPFFSLTFPIDSLEFLGFWRMISHSWPKLSCLIKISPPPLIQKKLILYCSKTFAINSIKYPLPIPQRSRSLSHLRITFSEDWSKIREEVWFHFWGKLQFSSGIWPYQAFWRAEPTKSEKYQNVLSLIDSPIFNIDKKLWSFVRISFFLLSRESSESDSNLEYLCSKSWISLWISWLIRSKERSEYRSIYRCVPIPSVIKWCLCIVWRILSFNCLECFSKSRSCIWCSTELIDWCSIKFLSYKIGRDGILKVSMKLFRFWLRCMLYKFDGLDSSFRINAKSSSHLILTSFISSRTIIVDCFRSKFDYFYTSCRLIYSTCHSSIFCCRCRSFWSSTSDKS